MRDIPTLSILPLKGPIRLGSIALLVLMLFSAYSNTFHSPPALDDFNSFIEDPLLRIQTWSMESVRRLSQTRFGWERLVPMLSFSWDIRLGRGDIFFMHLTNFLVHLLCSLSVLLLVRVAVQCDRGCRPGKEKVPPAWETAVWVASLWALHPLQTNAVTYIVQRMASMMALFYVLAVAAYMRGRFIHRQKGRVDPKSILLYGLAFACAGLAFLCKENAFMLPATLLLTEAWFFQENPFEQCRVFCRKHGFLSLTVVAFVCAMAVAFVMKLNEGYATRHFTMVQRLLTEPRIVCRYVSVLLFPHPGRLSLEHDVEVSTSLLSPPTTLVALLILMGAACWAVSHRSTHRLTTYGTLWFLMNLAVESSFIPLELLFEHRMYMPSIGAVLALVVAVHTLLAPGLERHLSPREHSLVGCCLLAVFASVLTLSTFQRNEVWKSRVSLAEDNVSKAPQNPRAHANLAVALLNAGRNEEAIRESQAAIGLGRKYLDQYCVAANTVVLAYVNMKEYEKAAKEGERLVRERPKDSDALSLPHVYMNLGMAQHLAGNTEKALQAVREGLSFNSRTRSTAFVDDKGAEILETIFLEARKKKLTTGWEGAEGAGEPPPAKTWVAREFHALGNTARSLQLLREVMEEAPEDRESRSLLQTYLLEEEENRFQRTKWSFEEKYIRSPFSAFNFRMAVALLVRTSTLPVLPRVGEALLDHALAMQPDAPDAHLLKGWYRLKNDDIEGAVAAAKCAVELDPKSAKSWMGLGLFLANTNRFQEATSALLKTLELYPGCPVRKGVLDIVAELQVKSAAS